jgi:hypothetical protein
MPEYQVVWQAMGPETEAELRTKLKGTLKALLDVLPRDEQLLFHYTDEASAHLIIKSGLRASDVGMCGGGVFFSLQSPADLGWPNVVFKENVLKDNYGPEAWKAPERQGMCSHVICCAVKDAQLSEVDCRPNARMIKYAQIQSILEPADDNYYYLGNHKFCRMKKVFKLYEGSGENLKIEVNSRLSSY